MTDLNKALEIQAKLDQAYIEISNDFFMGEGAKSKAEMEGFFIGCLVASMGISANTMVNMNRAFKTDLANLLRSHHTDLVDRVQDILEVNINDKEAFAVMAEVKIKGDKQ